MSGQNGSDWPSVVGTLGVLAFLLLWVALSRGAFDGLWTP